MTEQTWNFIKKAKATHKKLGIRRSKCIKILDVDGCVNRNVTTIAWKKIESYRL